LLLSGAGLAMPISDPKKLIKQLYDFISPRIKPSCGALFFAQSLVKASGNILASGTFGLVDTGDKKILVTCRHVLTDFLKEQKKIPT
jgi:hypothetical protein